MLGWALKKGFQGATGLRDAPEDSGDTTQFDAPDTPAPVFAARAIKNAIWGQSAAADENPTNTERVKPAQSASTTKEIPAEPRSPAKLNSILLTPGTGTSRRKRVSFGRDVKAGNTVDSSPLATTSGRHGRSRRKTTLQQALENSRPAKPREPEAELEAPVGGDTEEESEWEDEDICCNHEMTVDLNEPHSESGKYWKAEWSRYREEAKSDIEQLVKYKANARSFAAKKDMEASQLSQKLKEEQAKVVEMEKKMADMTSKLAASRRHGADKDSASLTEDLARQTTLVAQYRERVKDLETRLTEASSKSNLNRPSHHRIDTSPRTEQNILEVSRELRKARSELRQLDHLRDEVKRLKSNLATSRERVAELEVQASAGKATESSQVARLEKQLREVKEESRQKDTEIMNLERDYQTLKSAAKARTVEAMKVLRDKDTKIVELEKKLQDMEAAHAFNQQKNLEDDIAGHNKISRDLKSGIESLDKSSKHEATKPKSQHARAPPVDDITLDMAHRSLLEEEYNRVSSNAPRAKDYGAGLLADWTADIPTFELQAQDKHKRHKVEKLNDQIVVADPDALPPHQATRDTEQHSLYGNAGRISDVLSNRVNESSRRQSRRLQQLDAKDVSSTGNDRNSNGQRVASEQTASPTKGKPAMHGALDQPTRRLRHQSRSTRPALALNDASAIDLVRDQFTRLGGPAVDASAVGNTSRCALPAERQAAARARLEQKRMERRKTSGRGFDKENVRP
ncbi:spindle pole body formation-associated protein-domain-containing protein [Xylaria bambusicola]|uniref:spindle pole body formation-associated protein-domain-containing protein n=1 Tax=Xylaria bambusicola TaxID=326684 RepID=UPI00200856A0|nr:spindle pole body formation-associated protein-domain-containing protein [Xylaria bambusicola]KAI0525297.1 spindle pole body formation-associated protein-domain-containing protein [Xylaria bambusicola]